MEGPSIDLDEGESRGDDQRNNRNRNEQAEIEKLIRDGDNDHRAEQDHKLPGRNRTDNLVFDVDELWYGELLHI